MKKLLKPRVILTAIFLIFLIMQVFRTEKTNPPIRQEAGFLVVAQPPAEISGLLKKGCFDCHSNETVYPWYSGIAPVSWIMKSHITEGREHLNFSEWGDYQPGKRGHKLDECKEMIEKNEMPPAYYKLMHPEAKFSNEEMEKLKLWFTVE